MTQVYKLAPVLVFGKLRGNLSVLITHTFLNQSHPRYTLFLLLSRFFVIIRFFVRGITHRNLHSRCVMIEADGKEWRTI